MDTHQARLQLIHPSHHHRNTSKFASQFPPTFLIRLLTFVPGLGVRYSDSATLFVILTPAGPYFKNGLHPISLLAVSETVRAWPGGTGAHKLGLNYAPAFLPQLDAAAKGYDQILWLLETDCQDGEKGKKDFRITEVGAMNVFVVVKRDDGGK